MNVRTVVAGSVLAAGLGVAGMIGGGTASADPGAAVSVNSVTVGVGDAQASSSFGNAALAFNGGDASADGKGFGNLASANGENSTASVGNGNFNVVAASGKDSDAQVNDGNGNIVFAGGNSTSRVVGLGSLNTVANLCNGSSIVTAQSAQILVSPGSVPCKSKK